MQPAGRKCAWKDEAQCGETDDEAMTMGVARSGWLAGAKHEALHVFFMAARGRVCGLAAIRKSGPLL